MTMIHGADEASSRLTSISADTITDQQLASVVDVCGFKPGYYDVACLTCEAAVGEHCRAAGTGPRSGTDRGRPHAARMRAHARAVHAWRWSSAEAWNARQERRAEPSPPIRTTAGARSAYLDRVRSAMWPMPRELSHGERVELLEQITVELTNRIAGQRFAERADEGLEYECPIHGRFTAGVLESASDPIRCLQREVQICGVECRRVG